MIGDFETDFFGGRIVDDLNKHFRMIITPECAKEMLERNHNNRNLRKELVRKYSRLISQDLWNVNAPGSIVFSTDGKLIDGQHRLSAVVLANKAAKFNITVLADGANYDGIDVGTRRTTKDVMQMEYGEKTSNSMISAITGLVRYKEVNFNVSSYVHKIQVSESEIIAEYTSDKETWQEAQNIVGKSRASLANTSPGILSTYFALKCGVPRSKLENFFKVVNGGTLLAENTFDENNIALLARKHFLSLKNFKSGKAQYHSEHEGIMEEYIHLFVVGESKKRYIRKPTWHYARKYGERYEREQHII